MACREESTPVYRKESVACRPTESDWRVAIDGSNNHDVPGSLQAKRTDLAIFCSMSGSSEDAGLMLRLRAETTCFGRTSVALAGHRPCASIASHGERTPDGRRVHRMGFGTT